MKTSRQGQQGLPSRAFHFNNLEITIYEVINRLFLWYNIDMITISTSDIQHLASLSSLALTDDETDGLRQDLENIIGYIEQLGELDVSGVEPTYQVTGLSNVWREDEVQTGIPVEKLLDLAPEKQNNQVKVPQVL